MTQDERLAVVLNRLDRLEKQVRRWRAVAVVLLLGLGLASAMGATDFSRDPLTASGFRLTDDKGNVRAALIMSRFQKPLLLFYDEKGAENAYVGLTENGPELVCQSKDGKRVLTRLSADENGGYLNLWNKDRQLACSAGPDGAMFQKVVRVSDSEGKDRAFLDATKETRLLLLSGKNPRAQMVLHVDEKGQANASIYDKEGDKALARIGAEEDGGFLNVWKKEKQLAFSTNVNGTRLLNRLQLVDDEGKDRLYCEATKDTRLVLFNGKQSRGQMALQVGESGQATATLFDADGKNRRVELTVNQENLPAISCYDRTGKTLMTQFGATTRMGFITGKDADDNALFGSNEAGLLAKSFNKLK